MFEEIFTKHLAQAGETDTVSLLTEVVNVLRPKHVLHTHEAIHAIQALCFTLNQQPTFARLLREAILKLIKDKKSVSLFADSGIQTNYGFFAEMFRRVSHRILPDVVDIQYLKDVFGLFFHRANDAIWVENVPDQIWADLFNAIPFSQADVELKTNAVHELVDAIQVLSYRLSASGLEPELIKHHEDLENYASPFITQNVEFLKFLNQTQASETDAKHMLVILEQCQIVSEKVRRSCEQTGTSIQLTALIQRINQQLDRLKLLLNILIEVEIKPSNADTSAAVSHTIVPLFKALVDAECNKNSISTHWRQNMELMAIRVTENAGRTGEHYIAENRHQYFELMRSAMGAGVVIALMAVMKILITNHHYPPLSESILISLNYGLGFVLIHILHFTVATKQPAMTAATIAETIEANGNKVSNLDRLIKIISQTTSSQTIAILGNIIMVIPISVLIDIIVKFHTGQHFISVEKAHHLLDGNNPFISPAVLYAAIAGVCLFLAGLIAGFHDNLSAFNQIPERVAALKWLQKSLGAHRTNKVALYIKDNLGALAGNFYFGCLLGMVSGLGVMLGLPLDIRHVTFVSAFFGFSAAALDYQMTFYMLYTAILGIVLVATTNLLTSFFLALYVAMKSRKVRFAQWRLFIKTLLSRLNRHPDEFFLPPKT